MHVLVTFETRPVPCRLVYGCPAHAFCHSALRFQRSFFKCSPAVKLRGQRSIRGGSTLSLPTHSSSLHTQACPSLVCGALRSKQGRRPHKSPVVPVPLPEAFGSGRTKPNALLDPHLVSRLVFPPSLPSSCLCHLPKHSYFPPLPPHIPKDREKEEDPQSWHASYASTFWCFCSSA